MFVYFQTAAPAILYMLKHYLVNRVRSASFLRVGPCNANNRSDFYFRKKTFGFCMSMKPRQD